mmetsp:Transcript_2408/g.7051  ORF Transcript_2408/g.7051 Transcript_2408/m.7051 type:complete len:355 (+) Transcript_2408:388-1452(+)
MGTHPRRARVSCAWQHVPWVCSSLQEVLERVNLMHEVLFIVDIRGDLEAHERRGRCGRELRVAGGKKCWRVIEREADRRHGSVRRRGHGQRWHGGSRKGPVQLGAELLENGLAALPLVKVLELWDTVPKGLQEALGLYVCVDTFKLACGGRARSRHAELAFNGVYAKGVRAVIAALCLLRPVGEMPTACTEKAGMLACMAPVLDAELIGPRVPRGRLTLAVALLPAPEDLHGEFRSAAGRNALQIQGDVLEAAPHMLGLGCRHARELAARLEALRQFLHKVGYIRLAELEGVEGSLGIPGVHDEAPSAKVESVDRLEHVAVARHLPAETKINRIRAPLVDDPLRRAFGELSCLV